MTVAELEHEIMQSRNHALALEVELDQRPTTQTATELSATQEVIRRLQAKLDAARRLEKEEQEAEQVRQLEGRYAELCVELDNHYKTAGDALPVLLDASDKAFEAMTELRRTFGMLEKRGVIPGRLPNSFWPRYPALKNRFLDSVFYQGEP